MDDFHLNMMRMALTEAKKCTPIATAFCVGCILVCYWPKQDSPPVVLSRGYSRELDGNTHAEANALTKALNLTNKNIAELLPHASVSKDTTVNDLLRACDIYTTLEPCSVRLSGLPACADAIIAARIRRCYIGVGEPDDFVACEGARKLSDAGIDVIWVESLQVECLAAARSGHGTVA